MDSDVGEQTHLLVITRHIGIEEHVKFDVLKRRCLSNLPVNSTDIGPWRSGSDVDFEILNTSQEIRCVEIPSSTLS